MVASAGIESIDAGIFGIYEDGISDAVRKTRIQEAIDNAYGKRLIFTYTGMLDYQSDSGTDLTVDVAQLALTGGMEICGVANNAQFGTGLKNTGNGHGLKVDNQTDDNYNGTFAIRRLSLFGDRTNASGGSGLYFFNMNAGTILEDVWLDGHRENALYAENCYGMTLIRGIYNYSRKSNIRFLNNANDIRLDTVRSYAAGRIYNGEFANIEIDCAMEEGFGSVLQNCDVSFAGYDPFTSWKRSDDSLTSIAVAGNVATVTTATAHGLADLDKPVISGATVAPLLNSSYALGITVTDTNTFTIPFTPAANGTYTESTLEIRPPSHGLWTKRASGLSVQGLYSENSALTAVFLAGASTGFALIGGDSSDGVILIDGPVRGQVGPFNAHGVKSGVYLATANRHEVNVTGVALSSGATLTGCTKIDGEYRLSAAPGAGTWAAGDRYWKTAPSAGAAPGGVCVTAGTPGTWKDMANLAA